MSKTQSPKFMTLYEGPDFSLALEYTEDTAALHLGEFKKFTVRSLKTIDRVKHEWLPFLRSVGYEFVLTAIPRSNNKAKKLALRTGFKYIGSKNGFDVYVLGD